MGDNFERIEQLSEDEFQDYRIAFRVIKTLERSDKIAQGVVPSFTAVRNYLANVIAQYAINNL